MSTRPRVQGSARQGHRRDGARLMVRYNLLFWLLVVAIVALLELVATSFEVWPGHGGAGRNL